MKRSYYLIAAGVLTVAVAAVAGVVAFGGHKKKPVATETETAEPPLAADEPGGLPPLPESSQASLPPSNTSQDTPLVIPAASPSATASAAGSGGSPAAISLPPVPEGADPAGLPAVPTVPVVPAVPAVLDGPAPATLPVPLPGGGSGNPAGISAAPAPPVPVVPAMPAEAPAHGVPAAVVSLPPQARYLVLRGRLPEDKAGKLLPELTATKLVAIDGIATSDKAREKDAYLVRQGTIVRPVPKAEVIFAGQTKDDVYQFMRDRADKGDTAARLVVARWCMFNGMRDQALTEAREVLKAQPDNRAARELIRSLEESLKHFPDGAAATGLPVVRPVADGETDVTPEAATTFATRVQPILANLCVECHARPDYAGAFKLAKVEGLEGSPQSTQINLLAVAAQLRRADPGNSPLLAKAIVAHGGLRQPPFQTRQAPGYRALENWAAVAVGPTGMVEVAGPAGFGGSPSPAAGPPVLPVGGSALPALPAAPPGSLPTPPPTGSAPSLPPVVGLPSVPTFPPAGPTPSAPPPVITVPQVLPTPPVMTPMVPSQPPVLPAGSLPTTPSVPQPGGSQFGTGQPTPAAAGTPSAARDEFDPAPFNGRK